MKKFIFVNFIVFLCFSASVFAQIPVKTLVEIVKTEDELRFDSTLINLLKSTNAKIRTRAALASGRIGNDAAIPVLISLVEKDSSVEVRAMAMFAIGEIESIKGADAVLKILQDTKNADSIRARAVESAGKIAAANAKDAKAKLLGEAILDTLDFEDKRGAKLQNRDVILFGITAALRVRPEETDFVVAKFLTNFDARIRADAGNTLARVRAKNANETFRNMLLSEEDAVARANAARALGAAEDKDALSYLLEAATEDEDSRVRVAAIRSLGSLKNKEAADKLLERGAKLLADFKKSKFTSPNEKSELLEIATTLGRILPNSNDEKAVNFLQNLRETDKFRSSETEIAFAQIAPKTYINSPTFQVPTDNGFGMGFFTIAVVINYLDKYPQAVGNFAQGIATIADDKSADKEIIQKAQKYILILNEGLQAAIIFSNPEVQLEMGKATPKTIPAQEQKELNESISNFNESKKYLINSFPDVLRALAKLKPEKYENEIAEFLLNESVVIATTKEGKRFAAILPVTENEKKERAFYLFHKDAIVRATAAELMGEIKDIESSSVLLSAFDYSVNQDKEINDAQLAILDATAKQNKKIPTKFLAKALSSPDYLVRKRAADLIQQNDLAKDFPVVENQVETLKTYDPKTGTKLGQILNTNADYVRAVSRKNGTVKAFFTTEKGAFTIDLTPEDAPLTVDNFIKLAKLNYFNGLAIHRVVPNFVMQDGDPRGDGNGGPGWSIRCEINILPFERGAVGMALSGKDTGGSQWFVTHSPQPHLDGSYTVFGKVNEADMKIVDNLVRGDKILSVKIVEKILKK